MEIIRLRGSVYPCRIAYKGNRNEIKGVRDGKETRLLYELEFS